MLNIRLIMVSVLITGGVVLPRILQYFKIDIGVINILTEPWATYLIIMIAILLFFYTWLKNVKYFLLILIIALIGSFGLTLYFCKLPLPW